MASRFRRERPRVGLVLGGGGVLGAAWLMGGLGALVRETGWDPQRASIVLGTSAGAVVAALTAGSHRPWRIIEEGFEAEFADVVGAAVYRMERPERLLHWGSWRMVTEAWSGGGDSALNRIWAGILPHGLVSTADIARMVDRRVTGWPSHPRAWIVATDYESGRRHVFHASGPHDVTVGQAVAASCAIPGFYRPVRIGSRLYVDGGVTSSTNLDLLAGEGLDLIICMLPLSPATALARRTPFTRLRSMLQRSLRRQIHAVEQAGTPVLLIEPEGRAADLIGLNFMNRSRSRRVAHAAAETVHRRLRTAHAHTVLGLIRAVDGVDGAA
ncbi:MAG TPA: patatin-like phospholipase family protein [Candidatus Dormibacteraeota bacterium]|nr:patatin-like phospholipase family protein [Candidatus Dormibacteraeota bacterium]